MGSLRHQLRVRRFLLVFMCVAVCMLGIRGVPLQEGAPSDRRRPLGPEDTASTPQAIRDLPYFSPRAPVTCEEARVYFEDAAARVRETGNSYLIVIARHGQESAHSRLVLNRLAAVEDYLKRHTDVRFVTAQGSKVKGYGRIELFVSGKLLYTIPIRKNNTRICGV